MALKFSAHPQRHPGWLRWLLLCTLFSALHGVLGAWVVPAVASGPVTEICTPTGMQWVAVASAPDSAPPTETPQGLAQPCVWAMAHVAVPPAAAGAGTGWLPAWGLPGPLPGPTPEPRTPGLAERVLLMAPMRAPPA